VQKQDKEEVRQEAPGQLITHYAPDIDTYLVTVEGEPHDGMVDNGTNPGLEGVVVVDFAGLLGWMEGRCLAYKSLSEKGDMREAGRALFETLRWTESVPGKGR